MNRDVPLPQGRWLLTAALLVVLVGLLALLYKLLAEGALALAQQVTCSAGLRGALEALLLAPQGGEARRALGLRLTSRCARPPGRG